MLFPEAGKCAQKGTTREPQQGLTTRFDRTESDGLCAETPGPPRFTPPVCFPSPDQHESFTCCLLGFAVLDTTKKATEGCWVQDYDLLIQAPLNSTLTALGKGHALRGIIGNTEQFRPSEVLLNCVRLEQQIRGNLEKTFEVNGASVAFCQTARQQVLGLI